jgi:GrpB-like predicted nucleotidyltransferase (UPF0157 family)
MAKSLKDMTKEVLWQLFPIFLVEHQTSWLLTYIDEADHLKALFKDETIIINHIGSTAISGIWAKPIIDILVEIPQSCDKEKIKDTIIKDGYLLMSSSINRSSFNKGYTKRGFAPKVFHLHLRYYGDNDELYFRDYLNEQPEIAKQYEALKLTLWHKFEHDRDGYTEAKTAFITKYTNLAKIELSSSHKR